jgi:hypothetical protein
VKQYSALCFLQREKEQSDREGFLLLVEMQGCPPGRSVREGVKQRERKETAWTPI